jgi:hypothetical protein
MVISECAVHDWWIIWWWWWSASVRVSYICRRSGWVGKCKKCHKNVAKCRRNVASCQVIVEGIVTLVECPWCQCLHIERAWSHHQCNKSSTSKCAGPLHPLPIPDQQGIEGNEKMRSGNDYQVDVVTIANAGNGDLTKDKVSVFE